jgi:hypothetical protein
MVTTITNTAANLRAPDLSEIEPCPGQPGAVKQLELAHFRCNPLDIGRPSSSSRLLWHP